jgi:hypothetical protein
MTKIFIISEEILIDNQKWICDRLKEQFIRYQPNYVTNDPNEADYIWYIAPWNYNFIPEGFTKNDWITNILKKKKIITTIHHIDFDYLNKGKYDSQFQFIQNYATCIHSICNQTTENILNIKRFEIPIITQYLWERETYFYAVNSEQKKKLREKYNIDNNSFIIGNFQNDKKSKCPEILIKIIVDMANSGKKIEVIISGRNRSYIYKNLKRYNIKFHYFYMVSIETLNELYNCLNLYIISSKYEGGPRSIIECALTNTPVISTKVGIAKEFMDPNSLFDINDWTTYRNKKSNNEYLLKKIEFLRTEIYLDEFRNNLFS